MIAVGTRKLDNQANRTGLSNLRAENPRCRDAYQDYEVLAEITESSSIVTADRMTWLTSYFRNCCLPFAGMPHPIRYAPCPGGFYNQ